jgi:hypothetical protein
LARHARRRRRDRRFGPVLALVAAGSALLALPGAVALSPPPAAEPENLPIVDIARTSPYAVDESVVADSSPPRAVPRRLVIDAIGLDAVIEPVELADDGSLAPPESASHVGWFSQSSRPGELGPAVFVGHLDSLDGPAVSPVSGTLEVGDLVRVGGAGGSSASYAVSAVDRYPRESFPTEAVYGATPESSLRLITCGGPFERGTGYADNVVVAATPVGG